MARRRILIPWLVACASVLLGAQTATAADRQLAKPGKYPGGLPCSKNGSGAIACYQDRGDKIKDFGEPANFYFWSLEYDAQTGQWQDWGNKRVVES